MSAHTADEDDSEFPTLFVVVAASVASVLMAAIVFAGEYLPYTDWSKHAGLIEILARGDETGADAYWERTLRPTPYLSFYALVAGLVELTGWDADIAGRVVLVLAGTLSVLAQAHLLRHCGRDARWCVFAPLALWGLALGYGFGSFLFATPAVLFVFGRTEALLRMTSAKNIVLLAIGNVLVLLGHGLWVLLVAIALALRIVVFVLDVRPKRGGVPWGVLRGGVLSVMPAALLGLEIASHPVNPTERFPTLWVGADLSERLDWMKRALVGQFVDQETALFLAIAIGAGLVLLLVLAARSPHASAVSIPPWGLETYAVVLLVVALAGPKSLGGPIQVYLIYPRFLSLAIVLLLCVPRVRVRGLRPWLLLACMSGVVATIGIAQRGVVVRSSVAAADFQEVRRIIPRGSIVIALWAPDADDPLLAFPGFWPGFWLGVDGARFTTGLFNFEAHPVFRKRDVMAPREARGLAFRPEVHGADWEYVVVRGQQLSARFDAAPLFSLVGTSGRYRVYQNRRLVRAAGEDGAREPPKHMQRIWGLMGPDDELPE